MYSVAGEHFEVAPGGFDVLLAEDDDASRHFLEAALRELGCRVAACADGTEALALARRRRFDLLLLDCRMPGAGAAQILSTLRADADAASHRAPALATSAEVDPQLRAQLRDTGFVDVLAKPLSLQALQAAVQPMRPAGAVLDDATALASSGNRETVAALRSLFVDELGLVRGELERLQRQPQALSERLHRLLASCGFCGADALAGVTRRLKQRLDSDAPCESELEAFRQALAATLEALQPPRR